MKEFYISLVRSLVGYGIKVVAPNETAVRLYCQRVLGKMWCSVYTTSQNMTLIGHTVYVDEKGEDE